MADKKKKILFFHFDMQGGGAERVLVNLLKHLDLNKYDVTLKTIFAKGPYAKVLPKGMNYSYIFKYEFYGFNMIMKLFSAKFWHKLLVREDYDIEIAYLESSPARIISACPSSKTVKVAWVHTEVKKRGIAAVGFRNVSEMIDAFNRLDQVVFVAQRAEDSFKALFPEIKTPMRVLHNVNDFEHMYLLSEEQMPFELSPYELNLCAVNKLFKVKGFHRLVDACAKLKQDKLMDDVKIYILGKGHEYFSLKRSIEQAGLSDNIKLLGFDPNPYRYLSKMDLFVCTSYHEGYSTAVTESVALGVPVFTTDCSGMDEILEGGKYGMIVPNDDESIYEGLKDLLTHREKIKQYAQAISEAPRMTTQSLVDEYEKFFDSL